MVCADLDHLIFLPSGNTALIRRARKHSILSVVVLKWSRALKRYGRQGLFAKWQGDPNSGALLRYWVFRQEINVAVNAAPLNRHISFFSGKLNPAQVQENL